MDQNLNSSPNDFLWSLLENPANDANSYVYNLHRLVNDFPQSGILQALLAHASEEKNLKRASAYFNPRALFKLVNAPSTFIGVPDDRIVIQPGISVNGSYGSPEPSTYQESYQDNALEDLVVDKGAPEVEAGEDLTSHHILDELVADPNAEHYISNAAAEEKHDQPLVTDDAALTGIEHTVETEPETVHKEATHWFETPNEEHLPEGTHEEIIDEIEAQTEEHLTEAVHDETAHAVEAPAEEHLTEAVHDEAAHAVEAPVEEHVTEAIHEGALHETEAAVEEHPLEAVHEEAHEVEATAEEHVTEAVQEESTHEVEAAAEEHVTETVPEEAAREVEAPFEEHTAGVANEEITHDVEAHNVSPGDASHPEEERHFDHESSPEVYPDKAEHEHLTPTESEPLQQTIEPDADKDEPMPLIELPGEEDVPIAAETPVREEMRPEPEIPVIDEDDEVYDEIVGIEEITLGQPGGQYFSFDQEFGAHVDDTEDREAEQGVAATSAHGEADQQDVSKYHDEKMPYTFMWWLDKTRKEHTKTYQPYVKPAVTTEKKPKKLTDELQQQYFENIFHITSVEELDKSTPTPAAAPDFKRKEHQIIERFIKEEPQIKPQSSDKLDNENKAKKSSEDRDELVSETLASIYSDQMLYHKAIASYKKLMLKFPEKSRYFAEKIEQLEKKTN